MLNLTECQIACYDSVYSKVYFILNQAITFDNPYYSILITLQPNVVQIVTVTWKTIMKFIGLHGIYIASSNIVLAITQVTCILAINGLFQPTQFAHQMESAGCY